TTGVPGLDSHIQRAQRDPGVRVGPSFVLCRAPLRPPPGATLFPYTPLFRSPRRRSFRFSAGSDVSLRIASSSGMIRSSRTYLPRSEEHTSELQSREKLVCRLLLENKKRPADSEGSLA